MTLFKVLDSISEEENPQLLNVADECLRTLATHFPLHVVIRATKPIIAQENDNRVGPALKMLTRLIESLDVEELTARLPEIAPGVVNPSMYTGEDVTYGTTHRVCRVAYKPCRYKAYNPMLKMDSKQ
ncbi:hypothetical protein TELCIR_03046 [Teladorsagia circumcincta]|uniref:Uncharacterized protein n=1 Tax=Teladorsagia circumcincta TaxID=45464 RepID=A0A2G9UXD9_TELCI|nr:hypothetical protein TELCIR_03046 [Teladorsagia circumcincta]